MLIYWPVFIVVLIFNNQWGFYQMERFRPEMEFLDINLTKDSRLCSMLFTSLLLANLKKTILIIGFEVISRMNKNAVPKFHIRNSKLHDPDLDRILAFLLWKGKYFVDSATQSKMETKTYTMRYKSSRLKTFINWRHIENKCLSFQTIWSPRIPISGTGYAELHRIMQVPDPHSKKNPWSGTLYNV